MARRKNSTFDDLLEIAFRLPWWISLSIAGLTWIGLHDFASQPSVMHSMKGVDDLQGALPLKLARSFSEILQYLVPLIFILGAAGSVIRRYRGRKLHSFVRTGENGNGLQELNWAEFESLIGEEFRRRGYTVVENLNAGPDGGVDLTLKRNGELFLAQCKHWRSSKVNVKIVRELYGVMASRNAAGGFVVTSGVFTKDAIQFANGLAIELIDGDDLRITISNNSSSAVEQQRQPTPATIPDCPYCHDPMRLRTAKKGRQVGSQFWGCSSFPSCRGTRSI